MSRRWARVRWPWTHRVEQAEAAAREAKVSATIVRDQWPLVEAVAHEARRHYELNGINALIMDAVREHR